MRENMHTLHHNNNDNWGNCIVILSGNGTNGILKSINIREANSILLLVILLCCIIYTLYMPMYYHKFSFQKIRRSSKVINQCWKLANFTANYETINVRHITSYSLRLHICGVQINKANPWVSEVKKKVKMCQLGSSVWCWVPLLAQSLALDACKVYCILVCNSLVGFGSRWAYFIFSFLLTTWLCISEMITWENQEGSCAWWGSGYIIVGGEKRKEVTHSAARKEGIKRILRKLLQPTTSTKYTSTKDISFRWFSFGLILYGISPRSGIFSRYNTIISGK